MQIGMIGLGRMGANMVRRLVQGGHECVAYDPKAEAVQAVVGYGARGVTSPAELARALKPPARAVDHGAGGPRRQGDRAAASGACLR